MTVFKSNTYPPLVDSMLAAPGNFALPQAIEIAKRYLQSCHDGVDSLSFRYNVNPSLSFPPRDIESLEFINKDGRTTQVHLMLNLLGLHGAASPLPSYFSEYIAQHADEQDALRDFLDIFHNRLISILHEIWRKYRYYIHYKTLASDRLSNLFFSFIGAGHQEIRCAKALNWPRLMAYMGLIAFNGESTGSLECILRHYFSLTDIKIVPCIQRWVAVPLDQQNLLGENNCYLGKDFVIGEEVSDQTGKFRIKILNLTRDKFNNFLPNGYNFSVLQTIIKIILRSRLDFDIELHLCTKDIHAWNLDTDGFYLGWSTWAGDGGLGVVVLNINSQEL